MADNSRIEVALDDLPQKGDEAADSGAGNGHASDQPDLPGEFLNPSIWRRGQLSRASKKIRLTSSREIARYLAAHAGNPTTALLDVIVETDSSKFPEGRITLYVSDLLQKEANIQATDSMGNTSLHLAAVRGFSEVAKELMRHGADPHLENEQNQTPLELALHQAFEGNSENIDDYNTFAILMIKEMKPEKVRALFLPEIGGSPRLSFHHLLDIEELQDTVNAVLDTLIERVPGHKRTYTVYYDLLESTKEGMLVRSTSSVSVKRRLGRSVFEKIAWTGNKEAVSHLAVRLMMESKWKRFTRNLLIFRFIYWFVTMLFISIALILAGSKQFPHLYDQPVDIFRVICEGLAILLITSSTITELYYIYLWRLNFFKDYSFFVYNYLNLATFLFMIVLIPLRALQLNEQWIFAALLYMAYSIRVLRYVITVQIFGKYIQILILIIKRDLVPFIGVVIILLFIFTGGFYFALREEVVIPTPITPFCNFTTVSSALNSLNVSIAELDQAIINTTTFKTSLDINPSETSTYPRVFFTGIRIAVEGQNFLTYFGPSGFDWLGVMTYLIFLFFIEVILLNLLIAQMSDTFSNVQGDAQRSLAINKARTIISIEKTGLSFLKCITDFYKSEERWSNPQKHVEKLDKTSITNIHRIALKTQKSVNLNNNTLEDLRDVIAEQNLTNGEKLDAILKKLTALEGRLAQ